MEAGRWSSQLTAVLIAIASHCSWHMTSKLVTSHCLRILFKEATESVAFVLEEEACEVISDNVSVVSGRRGSGSTPMVRRLSIVSQLGLA